MILKQFLHLSLLAGVVLAGTSCQKESPPETQPSVKSNPAYVAAFGQPPVVAKGTCFARVGYYPLRGNPNRLRPVPFFLFDVATELPLLFERLVNNPLAFPDDGELLNPFPSGSSVRVTPQPGMLELDLILQENPEPTRLEPMAAALIETAGQYPDISRVRLLLNGAPWPGMPTDGFQSEPARIVDPGSPQLLLVVGSWEPDAAAPVEVLADFDRPVSVETFSLRDAAGIQLEGRYYTSVFDMAVVLHPQHPDALREGMLLFAEWRVRDRLGRIGEGSGRFELQRHEHLEPR